MFVIPDRRVANNHGSGFRAFQPSLHRKNQHLVQIVAVAVSMMAARFRWYRYYLPPVYASSFASRCFQAFTTFLRLSTL
jgi:hypothetical protein